MKKSVKISDVATLRQKAETLMKNKSVHRSSQLTETEMLKLIHEFEVHQIELELQNEELTLARIAAQNAAGKYAELYDFAPSGYFTFSKKGEILESNLSGATMLGKERESLKNSLFGVFVSDDTKETFSVFLSNVFKSETTESCEVTLAVNGNIPLVIFLTGVINENMQKCMATAINITDQKRSGQKLKEQELKLNLAMQAANMAWWEMDMLTGKVIFSNRKAEMLGYEPAKFKHYNDFMALVHPEDYEQVMTSMRGHLSGLIDKYETEYRILTHSGEYKWFYDIGSIVKKDSAGLPILVAGLVLDISNRKRSEALLISSETSYRRLFESAKDGILILDAETGMIQDVNPFLIGMLGYSEDQLTQKAIWEIGFFEDIIANKEKFLLLKQKKYVRYEDLPLKTADGREFNVEFISNVYYVGDKQVIQCNIRDITNRKREEAEQQKIITRLSLACRAGGIGIWELDTLTKTLIWDQQMFELYGIKADDFTGSYDVWQKGVAPDDLRRVESELRLAMQGKKDFDTEFRVVWPDETMHTIKALANVIRDKNGKAIKLVGTNYDITTRKLAEAQTQRLFIEAEESRLTLLSVVEDQKRTGRELRNSKTLLKTLLQTIPDLVWLKDKNGVFLACNKMFERFFGAKENNIIGKTDHHFIGTDQADKFRKNDLKAMSDGKPTINEEWITFADDGHKAYIETIKTPMHDSAGKLIGVLGIGRDITERMYAANQLIEAKEKAEESDRLKTAFLGNMSHEIRTPMNGILGFAQLLKEPRLTGDEQKEYINIIEKSSTRMLNIINDIISISKVESGQMEVLISETDINKQLEYLYTYFKPEVELKGMQLYCKTGLPAEKACINTDKEKIYSILSQLIKNAIKFSASGNINFGYLKKDNFLEFYVKDTGIGVSKEQKEFIFEKFRQGAESRTRNYEGAGLGLSISKAYVEILGGKIWVESNTDTGSTFYFTIPYNNEPEHKVNLQDTLLASNDLGEITNLKVLIVEDDEISEMLIELVVKSFSKEILKVNTGNAAVEACLVNPDIDLVLMDIKMSEMDGYEATRQIRQFNKNVIIIAQTAFGQCGDREKAMEAGCNDYISKPLKIALLKELIHKYFEPYTKHKF